MGTMLNFFDLKGSFNIGLTDLKSAESPFIYFLYFKLRLFFEATQFIFVMASWALYQ